MATKFSLKFTVHARKDLKNIFNYISKKLYAPESAKHIMKMIEDDISHLADYPLSAPLIDDEFLAKKGLRKLVAEDYIVIYKIANSSSTVIIYRVFNGKANYLNLLK